jgi:S1-C subfamily serine protease
MILTSLLTRSLIGLTAFIAASNAIALDAQQIFERVSPSVVVIKAGDALGSGVVYAVDNSGLTASSTILTNCHVVKGYTQVTVERLGKKANATVRVCDADRDMAIVTLGGVLPTLPVRTTPLKVGEPAFAVGAPQGLELSIS